MVGTGTGVNVFYTGKADGQFGIRSDKVKGSRTRCCPQNQGGIRYPAEVHVQRITGPWQRRIAPVDIDGRIRCRQDIEDIAVVTAVDGGEGRVHIPQQVDRRPGTIGNRIDVDRNRRISNHRAAQRKQEVIAGVEDDVRAG
ncbi:hypothetical protein Enr10x_14210 [Gimesia panareensis]|uniref:Uncharacterized protein n=1 Tax=Gimesia panareensis TaxID=2527978 RepID=A0A517Q3C0_9PLAN|nr:hypothetical protein Enr10x_14210 [Gimesia panareensis]